MKIKFASLFAAALCASAAAWAGPTFSDLLPRGAPGTRCVADRLEGGVILHQGGYVAEVQLSLPNGGTAMKEVLLGECYHVDPLAQFAGVKILVHTGLVWEPKRLLYTGRLGGQGSGPCLRLSGTTLDPKIQVLRGDCAP